MPLGLYRIEYMPSQPLTSDGTLLLVVKDRFSGLSALVQHCDTLCYTNSAFHAPWWAQPTLRFLLHNVVSLSVVVLAQIHQRLKPQLPRQAVRAAARFILIRIRPEVDAV